MTLPGELSAHKPSRLIFAILTLAIAMAGVVANNALSHDAIGTLNSILSFSDTDRMTVTARVPDATDLSRGAVDASGFDSYMAASMRNALGPGPQIARVRRIDTTIGQGADARSATLMAVDETFFHAMGGARTAGFADWFVRQDNCAVGDELGTDLSLSVGEVIRIGDNFCRLAAIYDLPAGAPFGDLPDTVFVPFEEDSFDTRAPLAVTVLAAAPAGDFDAETVTRRLDLVLETQRLSVWSSRGVQDEAARLKRLVEIVSNGLTVVVLLMGSTSIATLMSFSISERRREIAVRMTIGATPAQIARSVLSEALLISLIAGVVGAVAGLLLADVLRDPLNRYFEILPLDAAHALFWPVAKSFAGLIVIALLAGLGPALRAAAMQPATILREA